MRLALFLALLPFLPAAQAQPGCPDPQATNFNPGATQNDGSCLYPVTNYTPVFQANLNSDLKEISGLHRANGEWWGHNDSGYDPDIFSIDPETGIEWKKIGLKDAKNRDWEDICADATNLYIGDFGNNNNDRENLGIYKAPFSAIGNGSNQTINDSEYSFLPFAYPDQTDFSTQPEDSTVFDCEAMIFAQNNLQLFTKNRKEYKTTHYRLHPVTAAIHKLETFDSKGLITGASISTDGALIVLVGYDLRSFPTVFCWLLWDWPAGTDQYFSGNKRRIELGSALAVGQVESIAFDSARGGYIANESTEFNGFVFVPQTTRRVDFSAWVPEIVATLEPDARNNRLHIYPNPCPGMLVLETNEANRSAAKLEIFNALGMRVYSVQGLPTQIDLGALPKGLYQVKSTWADGVQTCYPLIRA
jgi:hypothetical protein